jgi:hypothetical protein
MSTTTCEHVFSVHNLIKTKGRNKLGSKNLEAMLRIALEEPDERVETLGGGTPLYILHTPAIMTY